VVASYGAEEAIIVTITYSHEARLRSYELLARAFGAVSARGIAGQTQAADEA
jgi:hypothetical protein